MNRQLTKQELLDFKPMNNYVLLKSIQRTDRISFLDGEIYVDTTYKPEHHAQVIHKVVATPLNLVYSDNPAIESMEWETEMRLKQGDVVWINYLAALQAVKFDCEGQEYFLIPYEKVYMAIRPWRDQSKGYYIAFYPELFEGLDIQQIMRSYERKNEIRYNHTKGKPQIVNNQERPIVPDNVLVKQRQLNHSFSCVSYWDVVLLNGYCLVEPLLEVDDPTSLIARPKSIKKRRDRTVRVRYTGEPNKQYLNNKDVDDPFIKPGDLAHTQWNFGKNLENELHREFENMDLWVLQRRRIMGVFKEAKV